VERPTSEHVLALLLEDARPGLELLRPQKVGYGERLGLGRARLHGLAVAVLSLVVVVVVVPVVVVVVMVVVVLVVMAVLLRLLLRALPGLELLQLLDVLLHGDAQALGVGLHVGLDLLDLVGSHLLPGHGHGYRHRHGGCEGATDGSIRLRITREKSRRDVARGLMMEAVIKRPSVTSH
jgi:hypothetical protein